MYRNQIEILDRSININLSRIAHYEAETFNFFHVGGSETFHMISDGLGEIFEGDFAPNSVSRNVLFPRFLYLI